ncbi:uncharacterized protein C8orf74 homolog [Amphiura filiformis]|uniref:uncharacterized protein C8orf74 homolog n=1 Tax=Amphiura filiformis TaxID=82378 RepID=UPI003B21FEA5
MATITAQQAKEAAKLAKSDGKIYLAKCLQWNSSDYDVEINMRGAIHLDYLYDSLEFAATKGFPWRQVCAVLELAEEFINKTVQNGVDINQAIAIYKLIVPNYLDRIAEKNLKIYTDYVFSTFMSHYKLYLYVFTRPREPQVSECNLEVDIPPEVLSLKEGKPERIWEYEQKMTALEEEETTRLDVLKAQRESLLEEQVTVEEAVLEKVEDKSALLQQEDLTQLIQAIAEEQVSHTEKILQIKLEERNEDLDYYLQKTSMPRPPELGPPPRTKDPPRYSAKSKPPTRGTGSKTGMSAKSMKSGKASVIR